MEVPCDNWIVNSVLSRCCNPHILGCDVVLCQDA